MAMQRAANPFERKLVCWFESGRPLFYRPTSELGRAALAQLVERHLAMVEVAGSGPACRFLDRSMNRSTKALEGL